MRLALLAGLLLAVPAAGAQIPYLSVTGRVVDAGTGAPIAGVEVRHLYCDAVDRPETCRPVTMRVARTTTDALGTFSLSVFLSPRVAAVRIQHAGYCWVTTPPHDDPVRWALWERLTDRLNAIVLPPPDLPEDERVAFYGEQDRFRLEILPVPHLEIALRRPPCAVD